MKKLLSIIFIALVFCASVFGQDIQPLPDVNIFEQIASLVMNWGAMGDLAKGSVIVMVLAQVVKQVKDFEYKNLVVAVLSVLYASIQVAISGSSISVAVTTALFSMGGAVLIYNALKPILLKIPALSFLKLGKKQS